MLELNSPDWMNYRHAYGDASDVPSLFGELRAATSREEWDSANTDLMNAVMHQGDVYTAMYAIAPYLFQYVMELGPGDQSEDLLYSIAYASRGGPGDEVPVELEDDWEEVQEETRDLILERLLEAQSSKENTGLLIAGLLYLSGEWSAGTIVHDWCYGYTMLARCTTCTSSMELVWHENHPVRVTTENAYEVVSILPFSEPALALDQEMEFDDDELLHQIVSLAAASGHEIVEQQMRSLFGTTPCINCHAQLPLFDNKDE